MIKSIRIKNIRGLHDRLVELEMIPNKPSILVAPNGSGKSSFALAFKSLNQKRIVLPKDEVFEGDVSLSPEIEICADDGTYKATKSSNEISRHFSVFVINNRDEAAATIFNIQGNRVAKSKTLIKPIVLINQIHEDVSLEDTLVMDFNLEGLTKGILLDVKKVLSNNEFMSRIDTDALSLTASKESVVDNFLSRLRTYTGTKRQILDKIKQNDLSLLMRIKSISATVERLRGCCSDLPNESLCLMAIRLIKIYTKDRKGFKGKIAYTRDKVLQNEYEEIFSSLKATWKNIRPKIHDGQLIIEISDTKRISNGERDIIVLLALLKQAESTLTKDQNILIIDEVFDYLDDANFIAAQYYVTKLIDRIKGDGRNIYPIILSHIDPSYFRSFSFSKMKIYYLNKLSQSIVSDRMRKLLLKRGKRNTGAGGSSAYDLISRYMLHFYGDYANTPGLDETILDGDLSVWINVSVFKEYCEKETKKYLEGDPSKCYDAAAVCIWLRECIEKSLYKQLPEDKRAGFIATHGTAEKISYADELGVSSSEVFSLLGSLYNDNLHVEDKNGKNLGQTLFSKLNNNTIRSMIRSIVEQKS